MFSDVDVADELAIYFYSLMDLAFSIKYEGIDVDAAETTIWQLLRL